MKAVVNRELAELPVYASKAISRRAKADPDAISLSFGEPHFGPPEHLMSDLDALFTRGAFLESVKRYEDPRGSLELRQAIAGWYQSRYGLSVDPENEIMVTHGGVEAIALAVLCTSSPGDRIAVTDPSYMLYERSIRALARVPESVYRAPGTEEYSELLARDGALFSRAKAIIVNSPENPSGYVLDAAEWALLRERSEQSGSWVIHDEVYDTMAFSRKHLPFRSENSIVINSFSKKFGIPGLRIGWMVADRRVIELASKLHDYLYLGVNIQYERIAARILSDARNSQWFDGITRDIADRVNRAIEVLDVDAGFEWPRRPLGAMFLFPRVRGVYERMPSEFKPAGLPVGDAVAEYLLTQRKVAVVPGSVYGERSSEFVRMVLCSTPATYDEALQRLKAR